jgi:eukaryotic-like serine/threonine-protein kinase
MARHWRCTNGHTWMGDIGALTYCPECNSRDVFEIRTKAGDEPTIQIEAASAKTFSQPRRAPKDASPVRPPAPKDANAETFVQPKPAGASGQTVIQPLSGRSESTSVQFPKAAAESTVTQIPAGDVSNRTLVQSGEPGQISTHELPIPSASESTMIAAAPAAAGQTLVQPVPDTAGKTLVCEIQGGPGTGEPMVCVPGSESPTFTGSSTSDSTLDLAPSVMRDATVQFESSPGGDKTIETEYVGATGQWDEPDEGATAITDGKQCSGQSATELSASESSVQRGGRRSGETAETKVKPGRREPPRAKPSDGKTPQVAGYEILGVLGRGGMGVVYKARQKGLNRLVALKMIIGGAHAGAGERGRFEAEALAVAKLQHTNIVQVYEVGDSDGLPYFSLEFIDGGSLSDKMDGKPLPARIAVGVVEQLARAVHYAHSNGIVHRDLKPANILLKTQDDTDPNAETKPDYGTHSRLGALRLPFTPKITDFGLAKDLQSESGLTGTGAIMGTPSFMSPEQAEGKTKEIGPATDIHALGAILYDALTGRPPFLGADPMATIMQVRLMEPVPPSRWQPGLPRDLETVCLKCLEKAPARRYATAGELADDLRRFLNDEPVHARPTAWWEKVWKWCRRRPATAGLIALGAVMILGGATLAATFAHWQHQRAETEHELRTEAENERNRARVQEQLAQQESARAQANFDAARDAMDSFLTRVGDERLRREPRTERLQAQLLEDALKFYDRFLKTGDGADPGVRREAGWAYQRAGRVREMLGKRADAIAAYRQAVRLFADLDQQEPTEAINRKGLADSYRQLAIALEADNQRAEADQAFSAAKEILDQLVAQEPADPVYRVELAVLLNNRGTQLASRRQAVEAAGAYRDALSVLEAGGGLKSVRLESAKTHANLGTLLLTMNQIVAGRDNLQRAVAQFEQLAENEDDPRYAHELGRATANLGTACMLAQDFDHAVGVYRQAETVLGQLASKFPRVPDYRFELAKTHDNIAEVLQSTKGRTAAEPERVLARDIYRDLAAAYRDNDDYRLRYALSLDLLGVYLAETGKREEAITAIRDSVGLLQKLAADDPYDPDVQRHLGQRLVNLGILLAREGQDAEAETTYARAIAVLSGAVQRWPALDSARKSLIDAYSNQAYLMKHLNRTGEEEAAWAQAAKLQIKRATDFPDRPDAAADAARTQYTLAAMRIEKPPIALAALRDAYDWQSRAVKLAPQRTDLVANLGMYGSSLVEALTNLGDHAAAAKTAERVVGELPQNWAGLPKIAGFLSQGLRTAREDQKLSDAEREQAVKQYGAIALSVIRRAVAGGYKDSAALQAMPELAPLRDSPEFKAEFTKLIEAIGK